VENTIMALPGVKHLHQLRTRKMAGRVFLDVHVLIEPYYVSASEGHYIAQSVQVVLAKNFPEIEDVTVHVDTENHPEGLPEHMLPDRQTLLSEFMPKWKNIVPESMVSRIVLYYFQGHLELNLTLSLSVLEQYKHADLKERFNASILDHRSVSAITLVYG
jgi:hypothetical protein